MTMIIRRIIAYALVLASLLGCKTKRHSTTQEYKRDSVAYTETARANTIRTDSVRITTQQEASADTYQIIEQYDTLGRLSTRVITARLAKQRQQRDSTAHTTQLSELAGSREVQATQETAKREEVKQESKPTTATARSYLYLLVIGIVIGAYLVWRYWRR